MGEAIALKPPKNIIILFIVRVEAGVKGLGRWLISCNNCSAVMKV